MVYFKLGSINAYETHHDEASHYWKLDGFPNATAEQLRERLRCKAYHFNKTAYKEQLRYLLSRYDRGLLPYEKFAVAELRKFCVDRQLRLPKVKHKANLIRLLEHQDENITFTRLLDLPPELRNHIYTLHFKALDPTSRPLPPPLISVSRQIRKETLLLFYQICTPVVVFCNLQNPNIPSGVRMFKNTPINPHRSTWTFFRKAPEDHLANLRNFQLNTMVYTSNSWFRASWNVHLGKGTEQVRLIDAKPNSAILVPEEKKARMKLEKKVKARLQEIMAREGYKKLRRDDLKKFTELFANQDEE